jgi:hypothetical protein
MPVDLARLLPTTVEPTAALVRDRAKQRPTRELERRAGDSPGQAVDRRAARNRRSTLAAQAINVHVLPAEPRRVRPPVANWQSQIPPGAIFYDEMADLTAGVDQPGLLLDVRV